MKTKKIISLVLSLFFVGSFLTACSGDPVKEEFVEFLNVQMVDVNSMYEDLKNGYASWGDLETDEELKDSINNTLKPLAANMLEKLAEIDPKTDEVKQLKEKFVSVVNKHSEALDLMLQSIDADEEESASYTEQASAKVDEALSALNEYNEGLEALAAKYDLTVNY